MDALNKLSNNLQLFSIFCTEQFKKQKNNDVSLAAINEVLRKKVD